MRILFGWVAHHSQHDVCQIVDNPEQSATRTKAANADAKRATRRVRIDIQHLPAAHTFFIDDLPARQSRRVERPNEKGARRPLRS